ncbi:MAG: GGDEF domain-containing protein [Alteromonas sp.]|nr:GGDEF domain-containing protein [Alteromonas sp.]
MRLKGYIGLALVSSMLWGFAARSMAIELGRNQQQLRERINQDPAAVIETINGILADGQLFARDEAEYQLVLSDAYAAAILGSKAISSAQRCRELALSLKEHELFQWCNITLAQAYDMASTPEPGLEYAAQAVNWANENNRPGLKAQAQSVEGLLQLTVGDYSAALEILTDVYLQATQNSQLEDMPSSGVAAYNLALVYEYQGQPELAIPYYNEAEEFYRSTNNQVELANALFGLGRAYWNLHKADKAVNYYRKSMAISEALGDEQGMAYTTMDLVGVQLAKREALTAEDAKDIRKNLLQAIQSFKKAENYVMQVNAMSKLAFTYRFRQEYNVALDVLDEALTIADAYKLDAAKIRLLELKASVHYRLEEYQQAFKTAIEEKKVSAEYRKRTNEEQYQQLQAEFEINKKAYENELLVAQNERQQAELAVATKQQTIILLIGLVLALAFIGIALLYISIKRQHRLTLKLAQTDELTGLYNRRQCLALLEREKQLAVRQSQSLSVAIADLDDFKHINDTHGHQVGDEVLKHVGEQVKRNFRNTDIIGRIGGEEFLFVFPAAACEEVEVALRKFMDECKVLPAALSTYPDIRVTFSIGLVDAKDQESVTHTLARADNLMYQAKANGKDQVVITN